MSVDVAHVPTDAAPVSLDETGPARAGVPRRWYRSAAIVVSGGWLIVVVLAAVLADLLPLDDPAFASPADRLQGRSSSHWFGTDRVGRDTFARTVYGSRVSLTVGLFAVGLGMLVGGAIGVAAGYFRGRIDRVLSWVVDVILAFPSLVLLIAVVVFTGGGLRNITLSIAFLSVPIYARLARAHTLTVSSEEFVVAARASGANQRRIILKEIIPNVVPSIAGYGLVAMSLAIIAEGSLSFLGLSVSEPTPSWGGLIAGGQSFLRDSSAGVLYPSAVLCLTILSLNVIGERIRRRYEFGTAG